MKRSLDNKMLEEAQVVCLSMIVGFGIPGMMGATGTLDRVFGGAGLAILTLGTMYVCRDEIFGAGKAVRNVVASAKQKLEYAL